MSLLATSGSRYKLKQFGAALVWEYLRNVGVDGAKPDVHMKQILGALRLGVSNSEDASDDEVIDTIEQLSKETGLWMAQIDYLFWAYCATGYGEICTANPRCDKCVIKEYCNKNTVRGFLGIKETIQVSKSVDTKVKREKKPSRNKELEQYRIKAAKVIDDYVEIFGHDEIKHTSEIHKMLMDKIGNICVMFQEADMCYNKTNKANLSSYTTDVILFEACEKRGYFRLLGQNYPYTGDVVWTKRSEPNEVVGHWENGNLSFWGDSLI